MDKRDKARDMVAVVKRKLHTQPNRSWVHVSEAKRLEAVEVMSGTRGEKDAEQTFSRVYRVTRKK